MQPTPPRLPQHAANAAANSEANTAIINAFKTKTNLLPTPTTSRMPKTLLSQPRMFALAPALALP
jgi:hypothetical protein